MIDFNRLNGPQKKILREALTAAFSRSSLDMLLEENGFGALEDLVEPDPLTQQVFALIRELSRHGRLDDFVAAARRELPDNPDLGELEGRLTLADTEAEGQRVVATTSLEQMVRSAGFSDLNLWAARLLAAGRRICRISYPIPGGDLAHGTGFLVAADRVLTNYHVVERVLLGLAPAASVRLSFGYAETAGGPDAGEAYELATDWLAASARYSSADLAPDAGLPDEGELDFALLRLDRPAGEAEDATGPRGWVELGQAAPPARADGIVFVLQHPAGEPLKQSIGVLKESATPARIRYDADTRKGSSGALVLDQQLAPVALHHAGAPDSVIRARYNQGIPLPLIHAALLAQLGASG